MEISEYKNIFENEERHFFYAANHNLILSLLKKYAKSSRNLKILDAGCGTGLLARKLAAFGEVWGIDISPHALYYAKKRNVRVKKASVTALPFKSDTFDVVVSIDVIYHQKVKNDVKALKEFYRVLKSNGILILRVPSNKWLHLAHDRHVHTRERYTKEELRRKLTKAGFSIEKISFVNMFLLPLAIVQQLWETIVPHHITSSMVKPLPLVLNNALITLLSFENTLISRINLPFGVGLITVCRKSSKQ